MFIKKQVLFRSQAREPWANKRGAQIRLEHWPARKGSGPLVEGFHPSTPHSGAPAVTLSKLKSRFVQWIVRKNRGP